MSDLEEKERSWPAFDDFVALHNGTLMIARRGIEVTKSSDGGNTWSEWSKLRESEDDSGSTLIEGTSVSLLQLSGGRIGLIYHGSEQISGKVDIHKIAVVYFRRSEDEGKTWSSPIRVSSMGVPAHAMAGSAIVLRNGRLVIPASTGFGLDRTHKDSYCYATGSYRGHTFPHESHGHEALLCVGLSLMSDDGGDSWHQSCNGEIVIAHALGSGIFGDFEENYVAELSDGRLMMFGRNCLGRIFKSYSEDGGETWHLPVPTNLASSAAPSVLKKIPGKDDLLVVWNQVSADEIRRGLRRARLSSAVSRDDGQTWEHFRNLEYHGVKDRVRIDPEEVAHVCALDDTGAFPDDYILCSYPNVEFHNDLCVMTYKHFEPTPQGKRMNKVRIVPIEWLYGRG